MEPAAFLPRIDINQNDHNHEELRVLSDNPTVDGSTSIEKEIGSPETILINLDLCQICLERQPVHLTIVWL